MCHFDPASLQCAGDDAPNCLTPAQVKTVRAIWDGPQVFLGDRYYPGLERGAEAQTWNLWIIPNPAAGFEQNAHSVLGLPFFRYFVFADPSWDVHQFNFKSDTPLIDRKLAKVLNATSPNLRAFESRGGKLIHYHGYSDPDVPPRSSIDYYEQVAHYFGGRAHVETFYRLFMVPGMGHCEGGPGANSFDMLSALERWVEQDLRPLRIVATKYINDDVTKPVVRTHPLCPYPQVARYTGVVSPDDAARYTCSL